MRAAIAASGPERGESFPAAPIPPVAQNSGAEVARREAFYLRAMAEALAALAAPDPDFDAERATMGEAPD